MHIETRDLIRVSGVGLIVASLIILSLSLQLRSAAAEIYSLRAQLETAQRATSTAHFTFYPDVKGLECWVSTGGVLPGGSPAPAGLFCDHHDK